MREWLKKLRESEGLTQKQAAEKLNITESYYSYIEAGERQKQMDITLAQKISSAFHVTVEQIVEFESTEKV